MLQTNLNFLFRNPIHTHFYSGVFYQLFQNSRRIQTLAANIPFPDGALARTFISRYRYGEENMALQLALGYPRVLTRYWHVANVLRQRGFVPFVHGQSAVWSVAQRVLQFLGFRGLQLLRVREEGLRSSAEIYRRIEATAQLRRAERNPLAILLPSLFGRAYNNLDHIEEFRSSLIASTIGLFHLERNESPFSFVVGGIYGSLPAYYRLSGNRNAMPLEDCIRLSDSLIVRGARARSYSVETGSELALRIRPFYEEASRLDTGQFLVFGVPYDRLSQAVYHSESFGLPTGSRIEDAIRALSEGRFEGGAQARLVISQETLADESPIEVVNVMDGSEVQRFCQGSQSELRSFEEDASFRELLSHTNPRGEESRLCEIEGLYARIDCFLREFLKISSVNRGDSPLR